MVPSIGNDLRWYLVALRRDADRRAHQPRLFIGQVDAGGVRAGQLDHLARDQVEGEFLIALLRDRTGDHLETEQSFFDRADRLGALIERALQLRRVGATQLFGQDRQEAFDQRLPAIEADPPEERGDARAERQDAANTLAEPDAEAILPVAPGDRDATRQLAVTTIEEGDQGIEGGRGELFEVGVGGLAVEFAGDVAEDAEPGAEDTGTVGADRRAESAAQLQLLPDRYHRIPLSVIAAASVACTRQRRALAAAPFPCCHADVPSGVGKSYRQV